jgi:hypothetical protein
MVSDASDTTVAPYGLKFVFKQELLQHEVALSSAERDGGHL